MELKILEAAQSDFDLIWPIFHKIVAAGETYAIDTNCSKSDAYKIWFEIPSKTYVAKEDGIILGTYYIKANQQGPGAHVCNCGYMVPDSARGKGVASEMCKHSQQEALRLGFKAMQYNAVVSTNVGAIRLWKKLGFEIVGTLPKAFNHTKLGYVNCYVMYKWLEK